MGGLTCITRRTPRESAKIPKRGIRQHFIVDGNMVIKRVWRRVKRAARLLRWGGAVAGASMGEGRRRLLVIYDFSSQPFSIGDILIFQEASLILRERHALDRIDFALVYDPDAPVVPDPAFSGIEPESFLFHLSSVLPAAQVNPYIGSLLLFDNHRHLEHYVADNCERYLVWPELGQYVSKEYLFYFCFNSLFTEHFNNYGSLPAMRSRKAVSDWAARFLEEQAGGLVPVTIQLRRNRANPGRDSDYDAWLTFMRDCAGRYPVKFVIVCGRSEIDTRFRSLTNAIVAKDHGTSLEQDLALLEASAMHMGMASGPATIINFSAKPYCLFKWDINLDKIDGITRDDYRYRLNFATPLQTWIFLNETPDLLTTEFIRMWNGLKSIADQTP